MTPEKSFEITLIEPLTHNECEVLQKEATNFGIPVASFHGGQNLMIRLEFDSDSSEKPITRQVMLIAGWLDRVGGVEIVGRIRKIEDYYTDFVSDEIKTLTKHKESS